SRRSGCPPGCRYRGVQSGELPAAAGPAEVSEALGADHAAREADQDRSEGRLAREVPRLPAGRGGGAPQAVRGDSGADRAAAAGVRLGLRCAAPDQPGPNVAAVRPRCAVWADFGGRAREERLVRWAQAATGRVAALVWGEYRCTRSSAAVASGVGVAAEAPGASIRERSVGGDDELKESLS